MKEILKQADKAVEKAREGGDSRKIRKALFEWGRAFMEAYDGEIELRPDNERLTLGDLILMQDTEDVTGMQEVLQKFVIDPETGDYMEDLGKAGGVIAVIPLSQLETVIESFAERVGEDADSKKVS